MTEINHNLAPNGVENEDRSFSFVSHCLFQFELIY